jgi:hypothetical protein
MGRRDELIQLRIIQPMRATRQISLTLETFETHEAALERGRALAVDQLILVDLIINRRYVRRITFKPGA